MYLGPFQLFGQCCVVDRVRHGNSRFQCVGIDLNSAFVGGISISLKRLIFLLPTLLGQVFLGSRVRWEKPHLCPGFHCHICYSQSLGHAHVSDCIPVKLQGFICGTIGSDLSNEVEYQILRIHAAIEGSFDDYFEALWYAKPCFT